MTFELVRFPVVDSTSSEAFRRLAQGMTPPFAVVADAQEAGRGSRGRSWTSPPGNLYLSLALAPGIQSARSGELSFVAAVAVAEAAGSFIDPPLVKVKWPNDILAGDAKLSGILVETSLREGSVEGAVVGIGVNIVPVEGGMPYPVTSLAEQGASPSRDAVLDAVLDRFTAWYERWRTQGFAPVREAWLARAWRLDGEVAVLCEAEVSRGRFRGVDESGALLLGAADGILRKFTSGSLGAPERFETIERP